MKLIQVKPDFQSVNHVSSLKSFPLRLVFILVTGFAVTNVGTRALALRGTAQPNPFAAYADIFPGQPASAIKARLFSCPSIYVNYLSPTGLWLYCSFTPTNGVFFNVTVIIFGGNIHQITFVVRENLLAVGDVELIFETSAVHKSPHKVYFDLPSQGSFAMADTISYSGQFSVFLPVRRISFTQTALPIS